MAVSPQTLEVAFKLEVERFEKEIDKYLSSLSLSKGGTATVSTPSRMNTLHFNVLQQKYLNAGWSKVELLDDQRDGGYIRFKY